MAYHGNAYNVRDEHHAILSAKNYSLKPLFHSGHLSLWKLLELMWRPVFVFLFAILAAVKPMMWFGQLIVIAAIFLLTAGPALSFFVLLVGVIYTCWMTRVRWPSVIYWLWWPFWTLALSCLGLGFAFGLGGYVRNQKFVPNAEVNRLQRYGYVDPHRVPGQRMQDAGVVTFNSTALVDRARGGCFKNVRTYCVAPLVRGGDITSEANQPLTGAYDFFMAGVDCCTCVGGSLGSEFRCGDYQFSGVPGGIRVLDSQSRNFFSLASADWSSTYHKTTKHPLFFTWVQEPVAFLADRSYMGHAIVTAMVIGWIAFVPLMSLLLNGLLQTFVDFGWACPLEVPAPTTAAWTTSFADKLYPGIVHHKQQRATQEDEIDNAPVTYAVL